MYHVKIIASASIEKLEKEINSFLSGVDNVISISYTERGSFTTAYILYK